MRIGFNVNGNAIQYPQHLYNWVRASQPNWMLVMGNILVADRVYSESNGVTNVIDRAWSPMEGSQWRSIKAKDFARSRGGGRKHIWRYLINEPDGGDDAANVRKLVQWLTDVTRYMTDDGYKVVVGSFPVGNPEMREVQAGLFDPLLQVVHERSSMVRLDVHEYTGILLPFGVGFWTTDMLKDGDFVQPSNWPTPEGMPDVLNTYVPHVHHILRSSWFLKRAYDNGWNDIKIVISEYGWDRMPDLTYASDNIYEWMTRNFGMPKPYRSMRGAYSYTNVWKHYYPNWSTARAIFEQLKWGDRIYPDAYEGMMLFTWSDGTEWDRDYGFNFGADLELLSMLVNYSRSLKPVEPTPVVPEPEPVVPVPEPDPVVPVPTTPLPELELPADLDPNAKQLITDFLSALVTFINGMVRLLMSK